MKKHYICLGGCNGVSSEEGACQAQDCPDYKKRLVSCECKDGKHERPEE